MGRCPSSVRRRLKEGSVAAPTAQPNPRRPWAGPVLRWAGSKRKLIPVLLDHVPATYRRYVEPFAGSACLFFALRPPDAILGDFNTALIETYGQIRLHPRRLARALCALPASSRTYYSLRAQEPSSLGSLQRALRFLYLNRRCFNGVYRVNRQGQFNVPIGKQTGQAPPEAAFVRSAFALRRALLVADDFERTVERVRKDDFVYLDPPYTPESRPAYGEYGYGAFSRDDHARLITALMKIEDRGAQFLLSYSRSSRLERHLPSHWKRTEVSVRRHVAGFARNRKATRELLVSNE